jgi:hypothetical protein
MPSYIELEKNLNEQIPNASDNSKVIFAISSSGMVIVKDNIGNNLTLSGSYSLTASAATSITFIPDLSNTASYVTSSNVIGTVTSASYSLTSSYALNSGAITGTGSLYSQAYILTGSYNETITSSYTLTSNENGKLVIVNSGSLTTITVPNTLPQGFACSMFQSGSGQISVLGSGVNIRNRAGLSSSYAQYSIISLLQLDTLNYVLQGDMQ